MRTLLIRMTTILCTGFLTGACFNDHEVSIGKPYPESDGELPGGPETYATGDEEDVRLLLYIEESSLLPPEVIEDAVDAWQARGLNMVRVESYDDAYGRVLVPEDHIDVCKKNDKGRYTLGTASAKNSEINMRVLCIQEAAERNDISYDEMVRVVTVHEIGHLMGIWDHVPRSCDEDEAEMPFKVTDEGYQICGHAFMNPVISAQFHVRDTVTELDLEAFDYRRAHVSILPAETVVRSAKDIEMRFDSE